ncbi:MAG: threonine synthase [Clostridiaceae bacterium]
MFYRSTRGDEKTFSSVEAIVKGIADDGGLFVPVSFPELKISLEELLKLDYKDIAFEVIHSFFDEFTEEELKGAIDKAYGKFSTPAVAPVSKVGEEFFLELYHGPTFAFKDIALTLLPYLMTMSAKKLKSDKEIVILTATSGDTGKAALEGFADVDGTRIIVFFPEEGVSEVQKLQMVTQKGKNVSVVGIEGNFDDAQRGVKEILGNDSLGELLSRNNMAFSSANSINIGRLVPQIVYYFTSYSDLIKKGEIKLGDKLNFVVPSGNFGNILAGYYAKKLGLPINNLICASNKNRVLTDFLNSGTYDKNREMYLTNSPSMDILVSSNLERYLYEICDQNPTKTKELMEALNSNGKYEIDDKMKNNLKNFFGGFCDEESTLSAIKNVYDEYDYLMDTHTAVAHHVYNQYKTKHNDETKTVIVSTASPFKFAESVCKGLEIEDKNLAEFDHIYLLAEKTNTELPDALKELKNGVRIHKNICGKNQLDSEVKKFLGLGE